MKIIDLSKYEENLKILEKAHYEYAGRQNIIHFMISNNMKNSENYNEYWQEYLIYLKIYNDFKTQFQNEVIIPEIGEFKGTWEVDFLNKEVKIYD